MNYSIIRYILSSVVCFEGVFLALPSIIGGIYIRNSIDYMHIGRLCGQIP